MKELQFKVHMRNLEFVQGTDNDNPHSHGNVLVFLVEINNSLTVHLMRSDTEHANSIMKSDSSPNRKK